ncbi:DUF6382 domain-containing protein [Paramaledivibacter caminithermalis]|jgi:hypothetical protein|uniref:FHA domain-containing protein n=1 Tax=Paramaledivibacter caminithermalis (strain DSM 15212 / CIP 107654 / DViRD3) TaxID=1121301 RepID=A0A1M6PI35_PARC5|nr:DUF6382 domain-containing protein [Paramaledivibacter caminithermalis]SHK07606.1 FHA domain-containing protein [Paramaledivibacter caminithermalis DSM 15212]
MVDIIKERFNFDYENDSTASYLVLSIKSKEKILQYQIEMIANNPCPGILKFHARYKNNDRKLYYNITSKVRLSEFLQRKELSKNEFIDILTSITKTIIDSGEYFLYDRSFLINEEYIYINPSTLDIGIMYIPIDFDIDVNDNFKSFLVNLIISLAKIDENSIGNYMQKILNYLKNDPFNIAHFNGLLMDLRNSEITINKKSTVNQCENTRLKFESNAISENNDQNTKNRYEERFIKEPTAYKGLSMLEDRKHNKEETGQRTVRKSYRLRFLIIVGLVQVLIIFILIFSMDSIKAFVGEDISAYGGITIIIAAIDALLLKKLFKKGNLEEIKTQNKDKKYSIFSKDTQWEKLTKARSVENMTNIQMNSLKEDEIINMSKREIYNINQCKDIDKEHKSIPLISDDIPIETNDTVILEEAKGEFPYMQRIDNGIIDKITITKSNFIIGRLPNYVDHLIEDNAVGRIHCEILYKEGEYFIRDMNSKNGTFINGDRIDSNREYRIKNNDNIKFADVEYIFKL